MNIEDELGAPPTSGPEDIPRRTGRIAVREKAHTREGDAMRPLADGSPWSRWMAPHRSLANVAR